MYIYYIFVPMAKCICLNCKRYLSWLQNIFVLIAQGIFLNRKRYVTNCARFCQYWVCLSDNPKPWILLKPRPPLVLVATYPPFLCNKYVKTTSIINNNFIANTISWVRSSIIFLLSGIMCSPVFPTHPDKSSLGSFEHCSRPPFIITYSSLWPHYDMFLHFHFLTFEMHLWDRSDKPENQDEY